MPQVPLSKLRKGDKATVRVACDFYVAPSVNTGELRLCFLPPDSASFEINAKNNISVTVTDELFAEIQERERARSNTQRTATR